MSHFPFSCLAITCPAISAPANGLLSFAADTTAPYDFATVATYICFIGYALTGADASRTCGGDGSSPNGVWSGGVPICEGNSLGIDNTNKQYFVFSSHFLLFLEPYC